jgi:uncharacterized protein
MKFDWSIEKSILNYWKHSVRFADAAGIFSQPILIRDVSRDDDEEMRSKAIGYLDGVIVAVVFTARADVVRIISARRANKTEREQFEKFMKEEGEY